MRKYFLLGMFIISMNAYAKGIIAQYYGIWTDPGQKWEDKFRQDTPFGKLTRIYVSFGKVIRTNEGGFTITFDGEALRAQTIVNLVRKINPTAEIFLSVNGDGTDAQFGGAANDPQFAENVKNFLMRYGFNGLDIDWEQGLDKTKLNQLTTNLYAALHRVGFKLTLDVWPFVSSEYDMQVLQNNLDQMNLMSYGADRALGPIVAQYVQAGFPADKLIGGIEVEREYAESPPDSLGPNGTIAQKARFVLRNGLAGMMEWRLDNDYTTPERPTYPTYQGANELWLAMNS